MQNKIHHEYKLTIINILQSWNFDLQSYTSYRPLLTLCCNKGTQGDSKHTLCISEVNPQSVINSLPLWVLATRDCSENTGTKGCLKMRQGQLKNPQWFGTKDFPKDAVCKCTLITSTSVYDFLGSRDVKQCCH